MRKSLDSVPVAHCPWVSGVLLLSHSWQRSACLSVTSSQPTGVTGRHRQLWPHSGLFFIPVRSNWPRATRHSCYVGGMSRTAGGVAALELDLTRVTNLSLRHIIHWVQADTWCGKAWCSSFDLWHILWLTSDLNRQLREYIFNTRALHVKNISMVQVVQVVLYLISKLVLVQCKFVSSLSLYL